MPPNWLCFTPPPQAQTWIWQWPVYKNHHLGFTAWIVCVRFITVANSMYSHGFIVCSRGVHVRLYTSIIHQSSHHDACVDVRVCMLHGICHTLPRMYTHVYSRLHFVCALFASFIGWSDNHFNNRGFNTSQTINDASAAHVVIYVASAEILKHRLMKRLSDHPMNSQSARLLYDYTYVYMQSLYTTHICVHIYIYIHI